MADGQTGVLAPIAPPSRDDDGDRPRPGPRRGDDRGRLQELVGRSIAPDGTVTFLGGRDVAIPVTDRARALASTSAAGLTDTVETTVGFDTYRVLTAVDAAVMVIDAAKGVEAQTIKLLNVCRLRNTPIITFVNKLDR